MKRMIFALIAIFTLVGNAFAEDKLYVDDVQIPQGGKARVAVNILSEDHNYVGFQFDLQLPEGISIADVENDVAQADRLTNAAKNWSIATKLIDEENNIYNFIVYNMSNAAIGDTDGAVLYITLTADASLTEGTELEGTIKGGYLSTKEGGYNSVDGTFKIEIVEDRIIFDETATTLPLYTAGEKANVRMNRTLKANKWNTIVLPFVLTTKKLKEAFGDDVQFAYFSGWSAEYDFDNEDYAPKSITINFKKRNITPNIPGGIAFLIKPSKDVESFDVDDVTLVSVIDENNSTDANKNTRTDEYETKGIFKSSFVKTIVPKNGLFISNEKFYYSAGETNIKGFRGWFELDAVLGQDTDFGAKVGFSVDGDATSVDGFPAVQRIVEGVYDLSGRKIQIENGDVNTLQKGVYIIDGKKVTIK